MKRLLSHLPKPSIMLITGRRGSGKTAKGFSLATEIHIKTGKLVYCFKPKGVYLPSYFIPLNIENFKKNSVVLLDDAQLYIHAREWYDDFNVMIDKLGTISRRLNIDFIITTQQTFRIDKNVVAGVDALVFCEPSLLDEEFERAAMKKLVTEARAFFRKIKPKDRVKAAYIVTHQIKRGFYKIRLPYYWSRALSLSYGNVKVDKGSTLKISL